MIDPETLNDYLLDLRFLHTETEGTVFEEMRTNLEAVASQTGMGDVFRLRGVDIHRVERCRLYLGASADQAGERGVERNTLRHLDDFVRRLAPCTEYEDAVATALLALDDLLGFDHAILLAADERDGRLFAVGDHGYPQTWNGAEVRIGEGMIGIAAQRRQVVAVANLARNSSMRRGVEQSLGHEGARLPGEELPLPGLPGMRSAAAVPLIVHGRLTGVLYLESEREGSFGPHNERLLRILGAHVSTTLAACARERPGVDVGAAEASLPTAADGPSVTATYYQADDSLFIDDEYLVKGVPARILWKLLRENASDGRTEFTNRELRLDESLGLPAGADNLEARLLVLRRRLGEDRWPIGLRRVARGRLELSVPGPVSMVEIPTSGPMRAAHTTPPTSA